MTHGITQTTDELADEPWTPDADDATFEVHDDDGVARGRYTNRWQKYGNDRLYLRGDHEGYVDLQAGEAVDLEPHPDSGIKEFEFSYDADRDALVLWGVGDEKAVRNSLTKKTRKEIARIPCRIMEQ